MGLAASSLDRAARRLAAARRVAVLTGAGVSAESGVPTFRGDGGLWRDRQARQLATAEALETEPGLVWEWYHWRRGLVREASPNPAHLALAALEERTEVFHLVTQNVDGLHGRAGSRRVLELHGSIHRARCASCGARRSLADESGVPPCPSCGRGMRPDVVLFGERLDSSVLEEAAAASSACEVFVVAGTSGVVQPAASLAGLARDGGAFVVEVNLEPTPLSAVADCRLHGPCGQVLPGLVAAAAALR